MTSEPHAHVWTPGPSDLARYCQACLRPMIPNGAAEVRWWDRIADFRDRYDCTAELEDTTVAEELAAAANGETKPQHADCMPAQRWAELPRILPHSWLSCPRSTFTEHVTSCPSWPANPTQRDFALVPMSTDAGRNPAPREEHTMAPMEIGKATLVSPDREDFGKAAERASTVAQFATMTTDGVRETLEGRSVEGLRSLADECTATQRWHEQGARDAQSLRELVGEVLRAAANYADPMEVAYATTEHGSVRHA